DALAHANEDEVLLGGRGAGAKGKFTEGGGLAVVGDIGRDAVPLLQQLFQWQLLPAKIDGLAHDALLRINQARAADADAQQGGGRGAEKAVDELVDEVERFLAAGAMCGELSALGDVAAQVDQSAAEVAATKVETEQAVGVGLYLEQGRRLATGRRTKAGFGDEIFFDKVIDDGRDGGPGQMSGARDVGAANAAALVDSFKHKLSIVIASVLASRFFHRTGTKLVNLTYKIAYRRSRRLSRQKKSRVA